MKQKLILSITLLIIGLVFLFGNMMTTTPGGSSGNGNPAILLVLPLVILFFILIYQLHRQLNNKHYKLWMMITILLCIIIHWGIGLYVQWSSYIKYKDFLTRVFVAQNGYEDTQYLDSITSGFSIHINNQFYNWNTYLMYISLAVFVLFTSYLIQIKNKDVK